MRTSIEYYEILYLECLGYKFVSFWRGSIIQEEWQYEGSKVNTEVNAIILPLELKTRKVRKVPKVT